MGLVPIKLIIFCKVRMFILFDQLTIFAVILFELGDEQILACNNLMDEVIMTCVFLLMDE